MTGFIIPVSTAVQAGKQRCSSAVISNIHRCYPGTENRVHLSEMKRQPDRQIRHNSGRKKMDAKNSG